MQGDIIDFLELVTTKPELARDLAALAGEHGFTFAGEGLDDAELEVVAGGLSGASATKSLVRAARAKDALRDAHGVMRATAQDG